MQNLKRKDTNELNLQNRNRFRDLENKIMVSRAGLGERLVREFGINMLYLKWITNKVLVSSTGNSAQ